MSYIKLSFGSPMVGSCFVTEGDTINVEFFRPGDPKGKQIYQLQVTRTGMVLVKKQFEMKAIRFLSSNTALGNIHQYIAGVNTETIHAIWRLMKFPPPEEDGTIGEHCFYENPVTGKIEIPLPDVEYDEIVVREAELFEVHEPGWEKQEWGRRERRTLVPKVGKVLDRFSVKQEQPTRVTFKRSE